MKIKEVCTCGEELQKIGWLLFTCISCGIDYSIGRKIVFVEITNNMANNKSNS